MLRYLNFICTITRCHIFSYYVVLACVTKANGSTEGGWDGGKPCSFPFNEGDNVTFNECILLESKNYATHGSYCATEVNRNGRMRPGKWGFCPAACPGGVFVGPSDVGSTCPEGTVSKFLNDIKNRTMEHCCCGEADCCWAKCISSPPPQECLPPRAEWKLNAGLGGYYQAVLAGDDIFHATYIHKCILKYNTKKHAGLFPILYN